jgi:hypothetical protein
MIAAKEARGVLGRLHSYCTWKETQLPYCPRDLSDEQHEGLYWDMTAMWYYTSRVTDDGPGQAAGFHRICSTQCPNGSSPFSTG